ncbi:serine carboxypeptidase-like 18 isoform X1 [Diospyros lotus]|uniref:serine carboxypeptidase-like 18 isoform X1 n=1 Tax=Diospyros lotus TaxID=55363 RepID=UPI00225BDE27|nr:serine carboxypeptidase-like 18 isoform X1 [Diospyros lotus]
MQVATATPCSSGRLLLLLAILAAALLLFSSQPASSAGQSVKYLPGYDGELPFHLQTGYISVEDSELFCYFIESEGNPLEDPLMFWLSGGPGCSSLYGITYEIGPMEFDIQNYTGGLPRLRYYPDTWTKTISMIFLDQPVGSGFSYSRTQESWPSSDSKSFEQSYEFLKKWLEENPQYLKVQLFVGGDSYAGKIVPLVTKLIVDGNKNGSTPYMNLKGMVLWSPRTDSIIDENSKVVFAHRMALISDEIYENAKEACNGSYSNAAPNNTACHLAISEITRCIRDLFRSNILEPRCLFVDPPQAESDAIHAERRSLQAQAQEEDEDEDGTLDFLLSPPRIPDLWCRAFNYVLSYEWANDIGVQEALHVRLGTVAYWMRCNFSLSYTKDIHSIVPVHEYLKTIALQVLVASGDRDMVVPFVGTIKWIKALNLSISEYWRPWFRDGQVEGYTEKFNNNGYYLTYATVKGAGHVAPEFHRKQCYHLFDRWIHSYPLKPN